MDRFATVHDSFSTAETFCHNRAISQVIPSACMEALMQHYQAAGFSREVSKFDAAPTCRRPSTNRMYDDRWLRFTTWATGRGFDQTIKGYRSCLASVLSRTGRAAEV